MSSLVRRFRTCAGTRKRGAAEYDTAPSNRDDECGPGSWQAVAGTDGKQHVRGVRGERRGQPAAQRVSGRQCADSENEVA